MKVSEMEVLLEECSPTSEIFFRDEEGNLHEITLEERPESFDGFDTFYEAGYDIVATD